MKRTYLACSSLLLLLPFTLSCSGEDAAGSGAAAGAAPPGPEPTYYADAKPILDAKCVSCHYSGGIAPFPLDTHAAAAPYAELIKKAVASREMPPWLAADGCSEYVGDRSLTEGQIDTLVRWVEGGVKEGDPAREGAPIETDKGAELSRVDLSLSLPVAYTPQQAPDDYRCFVVDWPRAETTYVTGFRATPGDAAIVHHVIAYVAPAGKQADKAAELDAAEPGPGYTCFGGSGVGKAQWIGGWAPGGQGNDFPDGTGIKVEPGSKVVIQMHYNTLATGPRPDKTSIDLKLDASVAKEARFQFWANPDWILNNNMPIPANEADVEHTWEGDPFLLLGLTQPITIYVSNLHMHVLGERARLAVRRAGGGEECLLDIPRWNFHWQGTYEHRTPIQMSPGDKLSVACHFDNTPPNQPIIDGAPRVPMDVNWGEGTTDEMCLGAFYFTQ